MHPHLLGLGSGTSVDGTDRRAFLHDDELLLRSHDIANANRTSVDANTAQAVLESAMDELQASHPQLRVW